MREMKDSGIEWIGIIPVNWAIGKAKYYISINNGSDPKTEGDIPVYGSGASSFKTCGEYKKPPCVLIGRKGATLHIPHYIDHKYWNVDTAFDVITNEKMVLRFYYYLSISFDYKKYISQTTLPSMTQTNYENMFLPLTSVKEQINIVDCLDTKCSEIDSLISDIQKQIDTLEEYKRSVITEAVTKGLDRDVEMKDSGIKWIERVPIHWAVDKVKFHLTRKEPRNPGDKQVLSVYREYGVIPKDSRDDNHNVTSEDTSNYKYVVPDNLVINKMKAWQGSMGISDYEGIVSPAYFIYTFTDDVIIPKYLHFLFRSCYKDEFRRISGGIREGQWDLSPAEFSNTLLLIPPKKEQQEIIDYLQDKTDEIDNIITEKKKQIETIEEYKKSLIFEYVTGKREVKY